ncbi:IclR family transcriptional regulator C-terminal domain-containing protein [Streptomyces goshikiensis]|uniref:IclR family transcriptional regulator domain-containing protein n=1 Tax=Streptomyces goshikiensis TaxID=1942 RepID=UPI00331BC038
MSAKAYRRFESGGIVPPRRAAFLDHAAERFGVELRVLDRAIDRIPAVIERRESVKDLLRVLREKFVERDTAWVPPSAKDASLVELARLYGRTPHRIQPLIAYQLAELRQREILIMRERAVLEYDTDSVRRQRAGSTIAEHSRHFNREVDQIPRRLESFHRMGQPSDVWQVLVDLYDLDARGGGPWVPLALVASDRTAQNLPASLVRTSMFGDVAAARLTAQGVTHVRTFRHLYGALYPAVQAPKLGGPDRAQSHPRPASEHQFTLTGPERFAVPRAVVQRLLADAELKGAGEAMLSPSTRLVFCPPTPGSAGRPRARASELPTREPTIALPPDELPWRKLPKPEPAVALPPVKQAWSALSLRHPTVTAAAQQAIALGGENDALRQAQTAHHVIGVLEQHPVGVEARRIEHATGLASQQLAPLMAMLLEEEFATSVADDVYAPGPALDRLAAPGGVALQLEHTLALTRDTVGAAVYFARYVDGEVRITQMADGPVTPRVHEWVDFKAAAHASAVGKCLLAQLPPQMRADHLSRHHTARLTRRTITDPRRLIDSLNRLAPNQPVYDRREYATRIECGAVTASTGTDFGTLALSMPLAVSHRLEEATQALARKAVPVLLALLLSGTGTGTANDRVKTTGGNHQAATPSSSTLTPAGVNRLRAVFATPLTSPDDIEHTALCAEAGPHLATDSGTSSLYLFEAPREHPQLTDDPALALPHTYATAGPTTSFATARTHTWQGHSSPDRMLILRTQPAPTPSHPPIT